MSSDEIFLQQLFRRIVDTDTDVVDELAVEMFCTLVQSNINLLEKCIELLISKIKSKDTTQALKALTLLEDCMTKCGTPFQDRVSKFRFLNELIRLVSKKHVGVDTPPEVREKIMDCLLLWTTQYPEKNKIKEAYDLLCKEGVQHIHTSKICPNVTQETLMSKEEEENLKKLLQSKNKSDIKKANLLIQFLVNQDAKRKERKNLIKSKLHEIQDTINVLNEVIDRWVEEKTDANTDETFSLMKEIYEMCEKSKPEMTIMPEIMNEREEELLGQAIEVNDKLLAVIEKYKLTISKKNSITSTNDDPKEVTKSENLLTDFLREPSPSTSCTSADPLSELTEIFAKTPQESNSMPNPIVFTNFQLLEPTSLKNDRENNKEKGEDVKSVSSGDPLGEIAKISENLLKANINGEIIGQFKRTPKKVSLNDLAKTKAGNGEKAQSVNSIGVELIDPMMTSFDKLISENPIETPIIETNEELLTEIVEKSGCSNNLLESTNNEESESSEASKNINLIEDVVFESKVVNEKQLQNEIKPLTEIHLEIHDIQPSKETPRKILDNQDLQVILNFALNKPSMNVSVIVISTINQNYLSMDNYQLVASVKKPCKLRSLQPTATSLPGVEPLQLPTVAIRQILLLFNPTEKPVDITFIIGYTLGQDPDPIQETIIVKDIPYLN